MQRCPTIAGPPDAPRATARLPVAPPSRPAPPLLSTRRLARRADQAHPQPRRREDAGLRLGSTNAGRAGGPAPSSSAPSCSDSPLQLALLSVCSRSSGGCTSTTACTPRAELLHVLRVVRLDSFSTTARPRAPTARSRRFNPRTPWLRPARAVSSTTHRDRARAAAPRRAACAGSSPRAPCSDSVPPLATRSASSRPLLLARYSSRCSGMPPVGALHRAASAARLEGARDRAGSAAPALCLRAGVSDCSRLDSCTSPAREKERARERTGQTEKRWNGSARRPPHEASGRSPFPRLPTTHHVDRDAVQPARPQPPPVEPAQAGVGPVQPCVRSLLLLLLSTRVTRSSGRDTGGVGSGVGRELGTLGARWTSARSWRGRRAGGVLLGAGEEAVRR